MSKKYFLSLSAEEIESLSLVCTYLADEQKHFEAQAEPPADHIWPHVEKLNGALDRLCEAPKDHGKH